MELDGYRTFEIKEVSESGAFVGIASVYGKEDHGGDVIEPGAFTKTIQDNPSIPILWQHQTAEVIGLGVVREANNKIMLEGQLDMDDPMAQKAYRKMKNKLIKGLSIGFQAVKTTWEDIQGRMVRHITELKLWEVSVVTFPMLDSAQITRVKSGDESRLDALEQDLQALRAKINSTPIRGAGEGEGAAITAAIPAATAIEPDEVHSGLEPFLDDLLRAIRN